MNIIKGKIQSAQKIIIYGPEGIGKSTFAAQFPEPLFIDTEGSTKHLDVARLPSPTSWAMLIEQVKEVIKDGPGVCKTLVIDTADWAEQLCVTQVCDKAHKSGIEDFGYGRGYVFLAEEFRRLLDLLDDVISVGIHVVITAHAKMRKFEQPDEMGAYDRWELKLTKNTGPMLKEWADMVLFANYKTYTIKNEETKKNKAQGGKRVLYTSHHPCWDAKNRHGLDAELPLDYKSISIYIDTNLYTESINPPPPPTINPDTPAHKTEFEEAINKVLDADITQPELPESPPKQTDLSGVPKNLADLMQSKEVAPIEIQQVVAQKGYFPRDMPIQNYPLDFIQGVLIGAWEKVYEKIQENRSGDLPF